TIYCLLLQQIRGNCSPTSMSTIRVPPKRVARVASPFVGLGVFASSWLKLPDFGDKVLDSRGLTLHIDGHRSRSQDHPSRSPPAPPAVPTSRSKKPAEGQQSECSQRSSSREQDCHGCLYSRSFVACQQNSQSADPGQAYGETDQQIETGTS